MARPLVRHALAALAAVALAACGNDTVSSSAQLDITPDKPSYTAGSTATITVRNVGSDPVLYNLCPYVVQRSTPSGWVDAYEPLVSCFANLDTLEPGETTTTLVSIEAATPAGTYRVLFRNIGRIRNDEVSADLQTRQSSRPFQVTG